MSLLKHISMITNNLTQTELSMIFFISIDDPSLQYKTTETLMLML